MITQNSYECQESMQGNNVTEDYLLNKNMISEQENKLKLQQAAFLKRIYNNTVHLKS